MKNKTLLTLKSARPVQTLFFIALALIGVAISGIESYYFVFLKVLIVSFLWQYNIVLNNIHDKKIDVAENRKTPVTEKIVDVDIYKKIGLCFLAVSLLLGFLMQNQVFILLVIVYAILAVIYSVPPFRLRNHILSTFFIGMGSVISFFIGYFQSIYTPIAYDILLFSFLIFIATSAGTLTKDIKDFRGDRKAGVRNIFTVYGIKRGKQISSLLLLFSFLLPLVLFFSFTDVLFLITISLISFYIFWEFEDYRPVIFMSFIVLVYCLLRLKGVI